MIVSKEAFITLGMKGLLDLNCMDCTDLGDWFAVTAPITLYKVGDFHLDYKNLGTPILQGANHMLPIRQ